MTDPKFLKSAIAQRLHIHRRIETLQTYTHTINNLSETSSYYLGTVRDNVATDTNRHPATSQDTQKGCLRMCGRHQMVFAGVFWCLMVSFNVSCCLEM